MNLQTTTESCKECGCVSFQYDDRLGEQMCSDCGLVIVVNPFEETVNYSLNREGVDANKPNTNHLGSYIKPVDLKSRKNWTLYREQVRSQPMTASDRRMKSLCSMYLSYYNVGFDIKNRAYSYYKSMQKDRLFKGLALEKRAASLTFYILKELGIICDLGKHSQLTKVSRADISKNAKKIARHQKKAYVFIETNHLNKAKVVISRLEGDGVRITQHYRENSLRIVEYISRKIEQHDIRFSDNMLVASMWIAGMMLTNGNRNSMDYVSQDALCKIWPSSTVGLRASTLKICDIFYIDRKNISKIDIDEFVLDVRY